MHATIHTLCKNRSSVVNEVSMTNSEFFKEKSLQHKKHKTRKN